MKSIIGQVPFFRLLIPVIAGVLFNRYFPNALNPLVICCVGFFVIGISFVLSRKNSFAYRWIFGAGLAVFLFGFTITSYRYQTRQAAFNFPETETTYVAIVNEIPQEKPRSIACNVKIVYPVKKKAVVYFQPSDESSLISVGDKILLRTTFQPFRNLGNPDDFDYVRFMEMRGFAASAYITNDNWMMMGEKAVSPFIVSQKIRQNILDYYRTFQLKPDQFAFLAAITLGYKASLSNDIREAFNASGTSHILAVSGYHVGVIYLILTYLFSFLKNTGKQRIVKQLLILLALWVYVFITGLPISAIRAATMLSVFCVGSIFGQRGFTYNNLAFAAFLLLVFNPYSFFELGFQLSFVSVFSIIYFMPLSNRIYNPKNKIAKYVWQLFAVSIAAQIGVFPLILYYFGMFPTYFFISNILVVPLTGIVMYAFLPLIVFGLLKQLFFVVFDFLYEIAKWVVGFLVDLLLGIVYLVESLPYSQITDSYISFFQVLLLIVLIAGIVLFLQKRKARTLLISMSAVLAYLFSLSYDAFTEPSAKWMIFNKTGFTEVGVYFRQKRILYPPGTNEFIPHPDKRILRLSENKYANASSDLKLTVDALILSHDPTFSLKKLLSLFDTRIIVLDSSIPRSAANRIKRESAKYEVKIHDVSQTGAFSMDF